MTFDNDRRDVHEGLRGYPKTKVLAAHRGHESSYQKLARQFYWHSMVEDVKENMKKMYIFENISSEIQSMPIPAT